MFLLAEDLGVEARAAGETACSVLGDFIKLFSKVIKPMYTPNMMWKPRHGNNKKKDSPGWCGSVD